MALVKIQQKKKVIIFSGDDAEEIFLFMKPKVIGVKEYISLERATDLELRALQAIIPKTKNSLTVIQTKNFPEYRESAFFDTVIRNAQEDIFVCCNSELFNYSEARESMTRKDEYPNMFMYYEEGSEKLEYLVETEYIVDF